jgi:hypothetical protein
VRDKRKERKEKKRREREGGRESVCAKEKRN